MTCRVKRGIGALSIILGTLAFGVGPTWAGILCNPQCTVKIDDLTDTVTVTGIRPNGTTPLPITLLPDSTAEFVHFNLEFIPPPSVSSSTSRDLLEADGTVSDRLLVSMTAGSTLLDVKFASDPATLPLGSTVLSGLTEDGTFQTLFMFPPVAGPTGDHYIFQVRSDAAEVPEPATIVLLLSTGTVGLGGIAWRRRR